MTETSIPIAAAKPETLDDIMLAMDVVDTLRHEREMVASDLNAVERREDLVARLRGIYDAQGISVPDDVLMDGVMALEEERFAYHPPKKRDHDLFGQSLYFAQKMAASDLHGWLYYWLSSGR